MFYIIKDEKLQLASDDREKFYNTIEFMTQLKDERVLETDIVTAKELELHPNKVIVSDIEIEIDVDDFETVKSTQEIEDVTEDGITFFRTIEVEEEQKVGSHKETIVVKGLVLNPDFETEEKKKERDRLNHLSLTKREVFLAIYKDKGITPEQIKAMIPTEEGKIEFDYANDYFRGNPLIEQLGLALGYTIEELDHLFEYGEFEVANTEDNSQDVTD